ncbi:FtsK/SpoIIIE family DNA translocase [Sulfurospirillum barnesii]|uniref:DNA segregation ATPase, FtsK/SpoIIIE family n=1 Tax=Sulfurospirillum barnesii (strain ATCC 700032 / DSM 10660 / SES-3) TaxID=760154 RepID=I3XX87_SULBS|nr:DNA translocase FtsK [Sulfurospirillum barnesii]AFL68561.1 DNA segregation ATPase, FtsK/SpoIIIE family [Sulfurospirillum barnesii SES-3]
MATILPDASVVGRFGAYIGTFNRDTFGYLAFIYPFVLVIPSFALYKESRIDERRISVVLAFIIFSFAFIMAQSLVVHSALQGAFGHSIVTHLKSLIGILGVWFFIIAIFLLSMSLLVESSINDFLTFFKSLFSKKSVSKSFPIQEDECVYERYHEEVTSPKPITLEANKDVLVQEVSLLEKEKKPLVEENSVKEEEPKKSLVRLKSASKVEILSEVEENTKLLLEIDQGECDKPKDFKLPPLTFLANPPTKTVHVNENEIDQKIQDLLEKLRRFKIEGDVVRTYSGPVVTTFEFKPAPHVKVSRILTLQDDLAMALKAKTIRIQAPVPGKDVVGIEVPNHKIETIYLKEILESDIFKKSSSPLTIALGKDIVGNAFVTDLKKLPHLLVAGTTGSGKSVGINAMLLSLLYRNSPDTLRFLMIDPKMLEFSIYNDIPHLLTPVITKPKQAIVALANMVSEMERRYQLMSRSRTKNIENYNEKAKSIGVEPLPYIVIIIDELADLMMTSGKDVEFYIARLAQMARASGIHIIVATQRPSVDVVTGLIKANLPSRISFKVGQKIDSKVILDAMGADSLLGNGDMLFTPPGTSGLIRLHAPYTSEDEIDKVVEYLKKQRPVQYDESFLKESEEGFSSGAGSKDSGELDELFEDAKAIVLNERKSSISYIQRRLNIGYNRAATIVEQLEAMGILSAQNSKGQREIIV